MAEFTEKLNLEKPAQEEFYDVDVFNANFQKLDNFAARTDNPHGVTHEQVKSLKIYNSFKSLNSEIGTSFDSATPIKTIIDAMPDNTGLKVDIVAADESIYPFRYGMLTIYKIRINRVEVEFVSSAESGSKEYYKRWIGQYNSGVFGGFKQVFTEHNPPTPKAIGAISKTIIIDSKDVYEIEDEGTYYCTNSRNVPTSVTAGYIRVMVYANNYKVVYWRAHNSSEEYVNVLNGGTWLGWVKMLTGNGGNVTGNLQVQGYDVIHKGNIGEYLPSATVRHFSFIPQKVIDLGRGYKNEELYHVRFKIPDYDGESVLFGSLSDFYDGDGGGMAFATPGSTMLTNDGKFHYTCGASMKDAEVYCILIKSNAFTPTTYIGYDGTEITVK